MVWSSKPGPKRIRRVLLAALDCSTLNELGEKLGSVTRIRKEMSIDRDLNDCVRTLLDINKDLAFTRALARRIKRQCAMLIQGE